MLDCELHLMLKHWPSDGIDFELHLMLKNWPSDGTRLLVAPHARL